MANKKIDKQGLWIMVVIFAAIGALYYFGYTTHWGAVLLNAFESILLVWSVLSPLYLLIRMGVVALRRRHAARLGLTLEQFEAQRRARAGSGADHRPLKPALAARWRTRLARVAQWELILFTTLLLIFGLLAQQWRGKPDGHDNTIALGAFYATALYTFLGLQVLHGVWAHFHHRLAPGSVAPALEVDPTSFSPVRKALLAAFGLSLLFVVVELGLSGGDDLMAVLLAFVAPAVVLLLLSGMWRLIKPMLRHQPAHQA